MQNVKLALTIDEASEYTGIGRNTIRDLIKWKKIPILKIGRKVIIKTDTLEKFILINQNNNLRNKDEVVQVLDEAHLQFGYEKGGEVHG